jgi:hypothetical protein
MGGSGLDIEFDIDKKLVKQANPRALEKYLSFLN